MMGTERLKGSHSMAGYHSYELCYLAAVYTNLLITKQPLDLHFKPYPDADRTLRVAPDLLPAGSIRIESVTIDGKPYAEFDASALTITLPHSDDPLKVKVRIVPAEGMAHFSITVSGASMILVGDLDSRATPYFRTKLAELIAINPGDITLNLRGLNSLSKAALRALTFERGKLAIDGRFTIEGASDEIKAQFEAENLSEELIVIVT